MNMHMLVLVIKHIELIDPLMKKLAEDGIRGCTILESTGMMSVLENYDDLPMFGVLRHIMSASTDEEEKEASRTVFSIVNDEELVIARKTIRKVLGDFDKPNSGIMFSIPVEDVEGLGEEK